MSAGITQQVEFSKIMDTSKISAVLNAVWDAISIASIPLVIFLLISRCSLSSELEKAKANFEAEKQAHDALKTATVKQNLQIDELERKAKAATDKLEEAKKEASKQNKKLDDILKRLKSMQGTSCEEGMPLIDAVIRRE